MNKNLTFLYASLERNTRMNTVIQKRIDHELSGGTLGIDEQSTSGRTKWEYTSLELDATPDDFTRLGKEGWELTLQSLLDGSFVFKRPA